MGTLPMSILYFKIHACTLWVSRHSQAQTSVHSSYGKLLVHSIVYYAIYQIYSTTYVGKSKGPQCGCEFPILLYLVTLPVLAIAQQCAAEILCGLTVYKPSYKLCSTSVVTL